MNRNTDQRLLWERFAETGSVGAYLLYCAVRRRDGRRSGERGEP